MSDRPGQLLVYDDAGNFIGAATILVAPTAAVVNGRLLLPGLSEGIDGLPANPTAQVGLTAVNGAATTFMRSDAAPALDQSISPTWTGAHIFKVPFTVRKSAGTDPAVRVEENAGVYRLLMPPASIIGGYSALDPTSVVEGSIQFATGLDPVMRIHAGDNNELTLYSDSGIGISADADVDISAAGTLSLASPALTGTPTAPTPAAGTNTTQVSTTAFVQTAIANLIDSSPGALDTLNELAAALGDDPNFATTVTNALAGKQPLDPTLTALAGVTTAADRLVYATGADAFAVTPFTAFGRGLVDDADAAAGRATLGVVIGTDVQAYDAGLAALASFNTNGILVQTADNTFAGRTLAAPSAGLTITNPAGTAGNPTFALANDLAALEGLGSTGIAVRTGADSWAQRSIAVPAAGLSITNADGSGGNPTLALANDLAALEGLGSTGLAVRTATDAWAQRSIAVTASTGLSVSNGDGVGGNPTLSGVDATTTVKGVASFNATNFSVSSGAVNTAQNIHTGASPAFVGLTLTGNLSTVGVASHLIPSVTDTYDLGSSMKPWRKGWLSELDAVLFAKNTISAVGGWMLIAKNSGTVDADVTAGATTVNFGQAMTPGDFVIFRAAGSVEYMTVGSLSSGTTYNVTRDVDGSGANAWPAGSVYVVLGQSGAGRIELNANATPRISLIRQGATYNAQTEMVRVGDLNGWGAYASETYGFVAGEYAAGKAWVSVDPTNGFRVGSHADVRIKLAPDGSGFLANTSISWDTSGNLTVAGNASIAGWTVNASYLAKDTGTNNTSAGMSPTDYPFFAGSTYANRASAPFRVTPAGALTATNATISGVFSASGGAVVLDAGGIDLLSDALGGAYITFVSTTSETLGTFNGGDSGTQFGVTLQTLAQNRNNTLTLAASSITAAKSATASLSASSTSYAGASIQAVSNSAGGYLHTTSRLSVGDAAYPSHMLHVAGTANITGALSLPGGVSGNVAFDTSTLFVDAANNGVGVGTAGVTTGFALDVNTFARIRSGLVVGAELGGYVIAGNHRMQVIATGIQSVAMFQGGAGVVEIWKDTTPTRAVAFGMAVPGTAITDDFIFSTFNSGGSLWQERLRILNAGTLLVRNSTAPGANPTGGGYLFADAGAGKWRGSSGTTTTFGPADPHCPRCGSDFALEWENPKYGGRLAICVKCLTGALSKAGVKLKDYAIASPTA